VAKGLIVGLPLQGHMTPLLALVRELVSRGDDLVVYSTPFFTCGTPSLIHFGSGLSIR